MNKRLRPAIFFMTKGELAKKYNVSVKTLVNWIYKNSELYKILKSYGYNETDKVLTPKQIEFVYEYLGEPEGIDLTWDKVYFPIRVYSKKELTEIYHTTYTTFSRFLERNEDLKEIKEYYITHKYIPQQDIETIFEFIGHPFTFISKKNEV